MKTVRRVAAVAALSLSLTAVAAPPPAPAAPAAKPASGPVEYPLSCAAAAKPLYAKGAEAMFNAQDADARDALKQALAADPKCVMAKATLAVLTPGAEGKKLLEDAQAGAAGLNEVEKLDLEAISATFAGDPEKQFAAREKLATLAPNVTLLQFRRAMGAAMLQKWEESAAAAKKATELAPKSGAAWNLLGYGLMGQKKLDEAVAAFRKYVEVAPSEPNAHDSLADALLTAGQLDEAAIEYQKAIDTSGGKFWLSWDGIATVKALKGEWAPARAALVKMKEAAPEPVDKLRATRESAWMSLAEGKTADALKAVDLAEKEAAASKIDVAIAFIPVLRGLLYVESGKYADGLKSFAAAEKVKLDGLADGQRKFVTGTRLSGTVEAHARMGKAADAEKAQAALEELYKATAGDPASADAIAFGRGSVALAKKDFKGSVESFKKCTEEYDLCRMMLADAQEKAGDAPGALETRTALAKINHRDPMYWFVHAQVDAKLKAPAKKATK